MPRRAQPLASDDGRVIAASQLAQLVLDLAHGGTLLVVSDFDGTLAELVRDPWGATIIPSARRALRRLAAAPGVEVVLLSGRTARDLAARARVGGVRYLGDHGAEWAIAARGFRPAALRVEREPALPQELAIAERLQREVPALIGEPWLVVEPKGSALTFHFRAASDVDAARSRIMAAADALDPDRMLVRSGGRRSLELRPRGASDKAVALRRVIAEHRPRVALMLGDDHSDALAFDALREARRLGRVDGFAVAVAGNPDVHAMVAQRADHVLASPREAARLLGHLASLAVDSRLPRGSSARLRSVSRPEGSRTPAVHLSVLVRASRRDP